MKQKLFFICVTLAAAILIGCNHESNGGVVNKVAVETKTLPANLPAAIALAKAENKLLLLEFGSSDSCPPCILFEREVFSKPVFLGYEKTNLVFVRLDFPQRTQLPPDIQATNVFLAQQFEAAGFPTFVALDRDGKEFWRMPEKGENSFKTLLFKPQEFIALLESVKAKQK
jgi:thioredoxin-related protein